MDSCLITIEEIRSRTLSLRSYFLLVYLIISLFLDTYRLLNCGKNWQQFDDNMVEGKGRAES